MMVSALFTKRNFRRSMSVRPASKDRDKELMAEALLRKQEAGNLYYEEEEQPILVDYTTGTCRQVKRNPSRV
jgi:hypothetical protein